MSGHSPRPTPTYALGGFGGWNGAHGAEGESHGGRDETRPDTQDVTVVLAVALASDGAHGAEGVSHGGRDETRPDTQDVTVVLAVALATLGRTVGEDLHLDLARRPSRTTSEGVTTGTPTPLGRCGRAFLPDGARRVYCSAVCSAKPVRTAEGRARSEGSRGTSTQRGYGTEHQRERQRQLAELEADGSRPCPICGRPMHVGQLLDLDHVQSIALGGRGGGRQLAHRSCTRGPKATRTRVRLRGPKPEPEWAPSFW